VILTWDEDDDYHQNHILTVFAGGLVKSGYVSNRVINHYTVLRTICDALAIQPFGAAVNETPITDVWVPSADVGPSPNGTLGIEVRPNPSSGDFEARIGIATTTMVDAAIYDAAGRRIAPLYRGESPGEVVVRWDGRWADGRAAAAGPYFLRVSAGSGQATQKLILLQ
jgi:hypothetical protein